MALVNFELCFQPGVFVAVNDFGVIPAPSIGETYSIISSSGITYCATVVGGLPSGPPYTLGTLFDSCSSCFQSIPVTANTIYESCVICDPLSSGATVTVTAVPHPVWTGLYGNDVIQGNAVQLGGQNGLYN